MKNTIAFGLILLIQNALDVGKILLLTICIEAQGPNKHRASFGTTSSFQFNKYRDTYYVFSNGGEHRNVCAMVSTLLDFQSSFERRHMGLVLHSRGLWWSLSHKTHKRDAVKKFGIAVSTLRMFIPLTVLVKCLFVFCLFSPTKWSFPGLLKIVDRLFL